MCMVKKPINVQMIINGIRNYNLWSLKVSQSFPRKISNCQESLILTKNYVSIARKTDHDKKSPIVREEEKVSKERPKL